MFTLKLRFRVLLLIFQGLITFSICIGQEQTEKRELHDKEFGWTLPVPDEFEIGSKADVLAIQKKLNIKLSKTEKPVFFLQIDPLAYLISLSEPYNTSTTRTYRELFKQKSMDLHWAVHRTKSKENLDSAIVTEVIDSLQFLTYTTETTIDKDLTLYFVLFARKFGNKNLGILIMSVGEPKRDILVNAMRNSKFNRRE